MIRLLLALACLAPSARAELRDLPPLPHPATIPTGTQEVGIPLELPVPELDRRPPAELPEAAETADEPVSRTFEIDMGGAEAETPASVTVPMSATRGARPPAVAAIERAVADRDPGRLSALFDGDHRAAVKALARLAAAAPLEGSRVESLLRAAEPLSVERIRDAQGRTPPPGQKQQLFNTSVHDALAARPLPEEAAETVRASLRRLASRAINEPASLADKLLSRFEAQRREARARSL